MKELDRAWARACRAYRAPGFRRAYLSGARAAAAGRVRESNPYPRDPRKTWRGVFRAAWFRGYDSFRPRR